MAASPGVRLRRKCGDSALGLPEMHPRGAPRYHTSDDRPPHHLQKLAAAHLGVRVEAKPPKPHVSLGRAHRAFAQEPLSCRAPRMPPKALRPTFDPPLSWLPMRKTPRRGTNPTLIPSPSLPSARAIMEAKGATPGWHRRISAGKWRSAPPRSRRGDANFEQVTQAKTMTRCYCMET